MLGDLVEVWRAEEPLSETFKGKNLFLDCTTGTVFFEIKVENTAQWQDYHWLHNNCLSFANALCQKLGD